MVLRFRRMIICLVYENMQLFILFLAGLFFNLARLDTACAHLHPFTLSILDSLNALKIWIPFLLGLIVSMTYVVAYPGFFATYFTYF